MTKVSLLIVDDENDLREQLVEQLEPLAVSVASCMNGKQALEYIQGTQVDAVLCDLVMPELDGLGLLEKVRELGMETPFVFMSGRADLNKVSAALRLGALDILEKPCSATNLVRAILRALEMGKALRRFELKMASALAHERTGVVDELVQERRKISRLRARK